MNASAPLRYTLTRQDALAYENLRGEMPGPQRVLYFLWLGLAGLLLAALPEEIAGTTWSTRFFIVGTALIVSILLSLFLARTIIQPLRLLVRAAIRVRLGRDRAVVVPRLPERRDEIDDPRRQVLAGRIRQLEPEPLVGKQRRQVVEVDLVL